MRVNMGKLRSLLELFDTERDPIQDRELDEFMKRPHGPILPKHCLLAQQVECWGMTYVDEVFLNGNIFDGANMANMILKGRQRAGDVSVTVLFGLNKPFVFDPAFYYDILGFEDGLPIYFLRVPPTCDSSLGEVEEVQRLQRERGGHFHGEKRLDPSQLETLMAETPLRRHQVIQQRRYERREDYQGYRYSLTGGAMATVIGARGEQVRYAYTPKFGWMPQAPFLHVTPPFKRGNQWRYWGTIGTHLCLMAFPSE